MTDEESVKDIDSGEVVTSPLRGVKLPAKQAVVFICQRCERRIHADHHPVKRLARRMRKLSREAFGKGAVRSVLTSCMSLCPRDALTVAVVRSKNQKPQMYIVDPKRPKAAARALVETLAEG